MKYQIYDSILNIIARSEIENLAALCFDFCVFFDIFVALDFYNFSSSRSVAGDPMKSGHWGLENFRTLLKIFCLRPCSQQRSKSIYLYVLIFMFKISFKINILVVWGALIQTMKLYYLKHFLRNINNIISLWMVLKMWIWFFYNFINSSFKINIVVFNQ